MASRQQTVRAALVGGPMYDALYDRIPAFAAETGLRVEVVVRLPHPELNAWVRSTLAGGDADIDLLSTHTKYAPSQAAWLSPLDDVVGGRDLSDLVEQGLTLARVGDRLLQFPRNLDVRLLHYRQDLLPDGPPPTWDALADAASRVTGDGVAGFLFPGRESGLFGTFYELLVGAGGDLFDAALRPAFDAPAGVWAARFLTDLHRVRRVTSPHLPEWHYDEISAEFRAGRAAMVCDWPGSYHLYRDPASCRVADRVGLALLPAGREGTRPVYAGCHSFAIPRAASNPEGGLRLLRYLTTFEAQRDEARGGAIPCRISALSAVQAEPARDPNESVRWRLLAEALESMIIPPKFAAYPRCEDAIWHAIQKALVGELSPEQAVAQAAEDVAHLVDAA
jgi:multiple sugar transport system substrate-binding protein